MRQVNDPQQIQKYVDRYGLQQYFSFNIVEASSLLLYDKDEMLSAEGVPSHDIDILLEGECIAFSVTSANKVHCELHYNGFHVMGLVGALWHQPAINNIRTITPCVMLHIPLDIYREMLLQDVRFLRFALEYLSAHIRNNSSHSERPEIRLASFILQSEKGDIFNYNLTICADLLEVSYRHLLRILATLCDQGILRKLSRGVYHIADREQLENLASAVSTKSGE